MADKGPLLAEISQKGSDILQELKPPEELKTREAPKKDKKAKKAAGAKKEAKKTSSGPNTFYENFEQANLVFKPEDLAISDGYYLREVKDSNFEFKGKIRSLFLEKCTSVKIICTVRYGHSGSP